MKEMKPSELRDHIKVLRSTVQLCELSIKTWADRGNDQLLAKKIGEQDAIIEAAETKKQELLRMHGASGLEIKKLKAIVALKQKQLAEAENRRSIEKLLETYKQLNELKKETHDGDDEVNQDTPRS